MNKIREQIEKRITDAGSGYVFTRKDFQDIVRLSSDNGTTTNTCLSS